MHTKECVENGYTREKEDRMKTRWEDACQRDLKRSGLRAGEETDRVMWRRKIISHTGDPTWWEKPGEKKKNTTYIYNCNS